MTEREFPHIECALFYMIGELDAEPELMIGWLHAVKVK